MKCKLLSSITPSLRIEEYQKIFIEQKKKTNTTDFRNKTGRKTPGKIKELVEIPKRV